MATSGSKDFNLDVAEYIEEAFERCGLEVRTGYDLKTAKRSMNLMLADWANRGLNQWTITQTQVNLVEGTTEYSLGADTIDVLEAVVRRGDDDLSIQRVSRDEFLNIPNKTTKSRVSQYFVDRQTNPVLKVWPAPENSTDIIVLDRLIRMDDFDTFNNNADMPFRLYPALTAGLAYYMSIKRAPQRTQLLKAVYEEELDRALTEDRDRASFSIAPSLEYYRV